MGVKAGKQGEKRTLTRISSPGGLPLLPLVPLGLGLGPSVPRRQASRANWTALAANYDIDIEPKAGDTRGGRRRPHALRPLHGSRCVPLGRFGLEKWEEAAVSARITGRG